MELFVVMTLSATFPSGAVETLTLTKIATVPPTTLTRSEIFHAMYAGAPARFREHRATVIFFSAEPEAIGGGR